MLFNILSICCCFGLCYFLANSVGVTEPPIFIFIDYLFGVITGAVIALKD